MMRGIKKILFYALVSARVVLIVLIALFLPKLGMLYVQSRAHAAVAYPEAPLKLGIENITPDFLRSITPKGDLSFTVGLISNQSGRDQLGRRTIDILLDHGIRLKKIFVPEHGLEGTIQDHTKSASEWKDEKTGIPVVMLYDSWTTKTLDKKMLEGIDVLMFDIQEMGIRHNTYLTTLFQALESAAVYRKTFVVLDRPNMLGSCMEGPLVEDGLKSAISYASIPVRHGMTVGELANYYNTYYLKHRAQVFVAPMANYHRYQGVEGIVCTRLSPHITSVNACYGYSFLGLLAEIRPFDVALGTDKAFQCIALPDSVKFPQKKWYDLHALLKEQGVDAKFHRYFSARKKQYCSGLQLKISNMNAVSSFKNLLMVVGFFRKAGIALKFSSAFDKAIGTKKVREYLEGHISKYELELSVNSYLHEFFNKASVVFKYRPHPYLVRL